MYQGDDVRPGKANVLTNRVAAIAKDLQRAKLSDPVKLRILPRVGKVAH